MSAIWLYYVLCALVDVICHVIYVYLAYVTHCVYDCICVYCCIYVMCALYEYIMSLFYICEKCICYVK